MICFFNQIAEKARALKPKVIAVACAEDPDVLKAVKKCGEFMPVSGILVGSRKKMEPLLESMDMNLSTVEVVDEEDSRKAVSTAVDLVWQGRAQMLMKGLVSTKDFLKGIVSGDKALTGGNLLSHVAVFEVPGREKLLLVSDAAMNLSPDVSMKYAILKNSLKAAGCLGIKNPKVAVLSAVEAVNPAIPSTVDAAVLSKMAQRDNLEAVVDGPLALDVAVSGEALDHKGIMSPVRGDADILLVPDLVSGNILYKSLVYFARAKAAGVVVGARVPVVLTSRADSYESKIYSIAMGMLMGEDN
ncbi:bifunctional enoyl-CoA hydratase/phosphate acetyltransferase [Thermoanaerobacterium sp. DL9XJH110]|uniref:bifunctional enoyl-CoA hydratase/phosphate acetyltransferase n=1 Tax=Thermoanaerobacterium sp. DL9XJH110 TaxID=3386643 RepID=UPI003BB5A7E5